MSIPTEQVSLTLNNPRPGQPLKLAAMIQIHVYVADASEPSTNSSSLSSGGFKTCHRVVLQKSIVSGTLVVELLVDDSKKISLTVKEFSLLKTLIVQLQSDASDPGRPPANMGWVVKDRLTSLHMYDGPPKKNNDLAGFQRHELARGVYDIREKLRKSAVSRDLLEAGPRGTHSYRISTPPNNVRIVVA